MDGTSSCDRRVFQGPAAWLAPDVHAVAMDADLVFLDVRADSYLCLVGAQDHVRLAPDGRLDGEAETIETLAYAGLASPMPSGRVPDMPAKPDRDLPWTGRDMHGGELAAAVGAIAHTAIAFRRHGFHRLLHNVRSTRPKAANRSPEAVLEAAGAFLRARPWMPIGGACLQRSYLMLIYLRRLGFDADWVIGVRTWPFFAHCWLQVDGVALDDDVERLVAYTPILRV